METLSIDELAQWIDPDELAALFGGPAPRTRGVLTAEWISRLAVPLEARGFRVDGRGAPIHFWWNEDQTGFVFAQ
jgi:hypothetical protein